MGCLFTYTLSFFCLGLVEPVSSREERCSQVCSSDEEEVEGKNQHQDYKLSYASFEQSKDRERLDIFLFTADILN